MSRMRRGQALRYRAAAVSAVAACLSVGVAVDGPAASAAPSGPVTGARIDAAAASYLAKLPKYHKHVTLTWWSWLTDAPGVLKAFEKAYPTIKVVHPTIGSGTAEYTKLTTVLAAGTGAPDVVMIEYDTLPQFIAKRGLRNIGPFLTPYKNDFPVWAWHQVTSQGRVYAVPEDQAPMGLLYQSSIFQKYKLPVPTTYAQFASDAAALKKVDPKQYFSYISTNDGNYFSSLIWQAGGQLFKQTGPSSWKITIDTPLARRVLSYWASLVKAGEVEGAPGYTPAWGRQVASGDFAAFVNASWWPAYAIDAYAKPNSQSFSVSQIPQWRAGQHTNADYGGSTNAVTVQTKHPLAAEIFATFINLDTMNLAEISPTKGGGGYIPANVRADTPPAFDGHVSNVASPPFPSFWKYANYVGHQFNWSPWTTYFTSVYETEVTKCFSGKETVSQALAGMQSQLVNYARSEGYSVSS